MRRVAVLGEVTPLMSAQRGEMTMFFFGPAMPAARPAAPPPAPGEDPCVVTLFDPKAGLFNAECPICLEEFTERTRVLNMPCGHAACERCGQRCFRQGEPRRCPTCREPIQ